MKADWKLFGGIALVFVVAFVALLIAFGGQVAAYVFPFITCAFLAMFFSLKNLALVHALVVLIVTIASYNGGNPFWGWVAVCLAFILVWAKKQAAESAWG